MSSKPYMTHGPKPPDASGGRYPPPQAHRPTAGTADVLLVFPPHWGFGVPHLALPSLAASARRAGFHVAVRDLNMELSEQLFSSRFLAEACNRIKARLGSSLRARDAAHVQFLEEKLTIAGVLGPHLGGALRALQRMADARAVRFAENVIRGALSVISSAFEPAALDLRDYTVAGHRSLPLHTALHESKRADVNPYHLLMNAPVVESLLRVDPMAVGISIASSTQLLPALTLARALRRAAPGVVLIAGGALTVHMGDALGEVAEIFDLLDFVVMGEGEALLNHILAALRAGRRPVPRPGLWSREQGAVPKSGLPEPIDDLPTPDFSDHDLARYPGAGRHLPLLASRGCAWGRCAFCGLNGSYHSCYRQRSLDVVLDDVALLQRRHHAAHILFNDEALPPARMQSIARGLRARGLDLGWSALARIHPGFSAEGLAEARENGLILVKWGLESGSQAILRRMGKGISVDTARQVFRRAAEAGIWNHVYVLLGFPGETRKDFEATRDFLLQESEVIHSVSWSMFSCHKGARIEREPAAFGIRLKPLPKGHIGPDCEYEIVQGVPRTQSIAWGVELESSLSLSSDLGAVHKLGLSNANLFLLVGALGHAELAGLLANSARAFRSFASMSIGRLLRLQPSSPAVEMHPVHAVPAEATETLAFSRQTGGAVILNEAGCTIFNVLQAGGTPATAALRLSANRGVPLWRTERDVAEHVRGLLLRGILTARPS